MPERENGWEIGAAVLPSGSRDVLPAEAEGIRAIEARLAACASSFGYREVMTPVLELADVVDRAQEGGIGRSFRLFDDHGRVMVLRPDLTIPVARLVATRMAEHPGPVRLRYCASRFRPTEPGRPAAVEERQSGVELVGLSGPEADAEVIGLLVRSLRASGLEDVQIGIGDAEVGGRVLDALGVPEEARGRLAAAAAGRNLVAWERIVEELALEDAGRAVLAGFPALRGGREVLAPVRDLAPAAAGACDWLERTLDLLADHGAAGAVRIDFGVLRDWSYYSGVVFEAYAPGESVPVAVGGRYDALIQRFGGQRAAVGYAIALDVLQRALDRRGLGSAELRAGVVVCDGLGAGLPLAAGLRAAGLVAIGAPGDRAGAERLARADGWRYVAEADGAAVRVDDLVTGRSWSVASAEAVDALATAAGS